MWQYLTPGQLHEIAEAVIAARVKYISARSLFLVGVSPIVESRMPTAERAYDQLLSDLNYFNGIRQLTDGSVPLEVWLVNAVEYTTGRVEQQKLSDFLGLVRNKTVGAPPVLPAAPADIPEVQIVGGQYLAARFLAVGAAVARSVAHLRVPQYLDGSAVMLPGDPTTPLRAEGTGWLLSPDTLVTAWHVVNAREVGEPQAGVTDLTRQVAGMEVIFDYDAEDARTRRVVGGKILKANPDADIAVLKLGEELTDRTPLELADGRAAGNAAVNIVHHPTGQMKKVTLRLAHMYRADAAEVQYFADTDRGSSGAPVCNDAWKVVAVNRAGRPLTAPVSIWGRSVRSVNVGVPAEVLRAVLDRA